MKLYVDERERERRRFEAAAFAMAGLLADHKDHDDERRCEVREVTEPDPAKGGSWVRKNRKSVYTETCAEAVARLAVEHADALLCELDKPKK